MMTTLSEVNPAIEPRALAERRAAPKPARIPLGDRGTYSSGEGQT
jgi:hypothetical protein